MAVPVTVVMGNAYYVFFVPMVIATRMPMPTVMGMPMTMCTGTSTIGKHASWVPLSHLSAKTDCVTEDLFDFVHSPPSLL